MDNVVKKVIRAAKKDPLIVAVALFGSLARGEKHRDIDLCIFLKPKQYSDLALSRKKMEYLPDEKGYDLEIFQQLPVYIQNRIVKEAKILYCKNEDLLYDLYFAAIREFEDFQHIYEGYLNAVQNG